MNAADFFAKWTAEEASLRQRGALVAGADFCAEIMVDVRAMLDMEANVLLTLTAAAKQSGYSADHLGRLLRIGAIPNAGRPHAPRIRVGDLPRKPKATLPRPTLMAYDPATDARTLLARRRGERHG